MKTFKWSELSHKASPERRTTLRRQAVEEVERTGFAALRQARHQTQVELARKLGISQASISEIEKRDDLLLSTLRKYIAALGGRIEVRAVFSEASFVLDPLLGPVPDKVLARIGTAPKVVSKVSGQPGKPARSQRAFKTAARGGAQASRTARLKHRAS